MSAAAARRTKSECARWAIRKPSPTKSVKRQSTTMTPRKPSSSPTAAKIMSEEISGTVPDWPRPRPVPVMPPAASENHP